MIRAPPSTGMVTWAHAERTPVFDTTMHTAVPAALHDDNDTHTSSTGRAPTMRWHASTARPWMAEEKRVVELEVSDAELAAAAQYASWQQEEHEISRVLAAAAEYPERQPMLRSRSPSQDSVFSSQSSSDCTTPVRVHWPQRCEDVPMSRSVHELEVLLAARTSELRRTQEDLALLSKRHEKTELLMLLRDPRTSRELANEGSGRSRRRSGSASEGLSRSRGQSRTIRRTSGLLECPVPPRAACDLIDELMLF